MALAVVRPRGRPTEDRVERCAAIWRAVAPEIRKRRYRGVTIKSLARVCHLAPASLYHYFPSKEDLILYPLQSYAQFCERAVARLELLPADPRARLNAYLEIAIGLHVDLTLAAELAAEAGLQQRYRSALVEKYDRARRVLTRLIATAYPTMSAESASGLADRLVALVAGWYSSGRRGGTDSVVHACQSEIDAAVRN
ncbi:MAG: TetR/AcrR family transcriptional regulator [Candidatus Dormibacteraeota bacterium]|nr:TetR/AcrR family transcriptional regulator [Candidatus Dormibacteraeota bacterium]